LDEPFSALDAELRHRMRELVRRVQRELSITMLFVTHDQQEAVDLADAVVLMLDGRVEGAGTPSSFYTDPPTLAAARFFGATNEIPGTATGSAFTCPLGELQLGRPAPDGPGVLVVRPETVRLLGADGPPNTVTATVRETRFRGTHRTVVAVAAGTVLTATVAPAVPVEAGDRVHLQLPPAACRVLPTTALPTVTTTENEDARA
ncbi:MAG: TOBE domain-containing protein, partial [Pseudonocardia sp.]|nr:TOBE domain-containing protein [Pseudonocardia sp.]